MPASGSSLTTARRSDTSSTTISSTSSARGRRADQRGPRRGSSLYGDFLYDLAKLLFYQPWYPAWRNIAFAAEARAHYEAIGLAVPNFADRLLCYALRIGLADMAYSAFRKRWDQLAKKAGRTLELAG